MDLKHTISTDMDVPSTILSHAARRRDRLHRHRPLGRSGARG
jgi:hypothetical protein